MGIFSSIKKQFIDVIDWTEPAEGILAYRYPMQDREIQNGGQLTVRDSQLALFVNEGKVADQFGPGLFTLTTRTLPVLTTLKNWDKLFNSPFKSDVYFLSAREQIGRKWGTAAPLTIRDKEFGPIRIRAFGTYSFKIKDAKTFYQKISGTSEVYTVDQLEDQMRSAIMTSLATTLGGSAVNFLDMAANQSKFSETLKTGLLSEFVNYGLELQTFFVQSVSLPEELQTALDKKASMNMLGDLSQYVQYQTAESLPAAAAASGGAAGAGAGLAAGMVMAQQMMGSMNGGGNKSGEDPMVTISKLHDLLQKGVISQAEFDSKKAELLKRI